MQADTRPDGKPVWTPLVAVSLLIWFVLAMQCMSTLAIVRRETGGWRWPIAMLAVHERPGVRALPDRVPGRSRDGV